MEAAEVAMVVAALAAVATAAETSEKKGEVAEVGTAPDRTEGPQDRGCPHTAAAPRVNRKAAARAKHATEASTRGPTAPATSARVTVRRCCGRAVWGACSANHNLLTLHSLPLEIVRV